MENIREEILGILTELHDDIDYDAVNTLIDDHYLDSLDIVTLIAELNDAFDISIPPQEIVESNFNSLDALTKMVNRLIG